MKNKFYVTTPIYYINDIPHIGHTCTTVVADVLARLHKQTGEDVFFLTGTDEHGQKVADAAKEAGFNDVQKYCDNIAPRFEKAWRDLNIGFDHFIRTTDPRHEQVVKDLLQKIYDKGDIYKDKYEGLYCIGCEKFLTESDLVDGHCPLHPSEKTVQQSEENWFFRLSKYIPQIIKLIEDDGTNYINPPGKRAEVLAKLRAGIKDISISRANVSWGIPLPWDKSQTTYVWFDALINYYSATQFLENKKDFWPANLHILGKEILWFHTVIWQAMLLAAGLEVPLKTFTHSFYMIDGQKMSKSLGNVISPSQLINSFGVDGARYLVATSFPRDNDADVGIGKYKDRYNADLANNLGNLVSRLAKMGEGLKIETNKIEYGVQIKELIDDLRFNEAVLLIFEKWINPVNLKLNQEEPWKKDFEDKDRQELLIWCGEQIIKAAYHLLPFIPQTGQAIIDLFSGEIKTPKEGLFKRVA